MLNEALVLRPVILKNANLPWRNIVHLGKKLSFTKGMIVGGTLAPPGVLYFIQKGIVRLSYPAANGEEQVLCCFGENTIFNEIPALMNVNLCIFTCLEKVEAVALDLSMLCAHEFIATHPEIMISWLESTTLKAALYYHLLTSTGVYSSFTNVCRLLYSMHLNNRKGNKIVPYLTKQDFASMLSIHRASLHKALSRLQEEGVIGAYSRNELEVKNLPLLKQYAFVD